MIRAESFLRVVAVSLVSVACGSSSGDAGQAASGAGGSAGMAAGTGGSAGVGPGGAAGSGPATAGGAGASGASGELPKGEPIEGCAGAKLLTTGTDPGARGAWPVGARTVTIAGLTTEVWYPAVIGSQAGKDRVKYDIREHLPDADAQKIPDADNPLQDCDCHRDLPLDEAHGPYPVVLFIHGTAAFRTQSLTQMTHWASRGFVVISADHPKIQLKDALTNLLGTGMADQVGDAKKILASVAALDGGPLAFLSGHLDATRLAVSGHSAGGGAAASFAAQAQVIIPMAAGGTKAGTPSTLILGGQADTIAAYSQQQMGYQSSPTKKRLVGLSNAGHLAFSDLCFLGRDKGGILQIAKDHGVNVNPLVATPAQDGCKPGQLAAEEGWKIVDSTTSAALEETLMCNGAMTAALSATKATFVSVGDYQEALLRLRRDHLAPGTSSDNFPAGRPTRAIPSPGGTLVQL
jgi:hypothetical protein